MSAVQERAFDTLLPAQPQGLSDGLVHVVEIGRQGPDGGPWGRADLATLVDRIAQGPPRVIGLDMVLAGGCGPDSAPNSATLALAQSLARAATQSPVILGFLLNDAEGQMGEVEPRATSPQLAVMADAPAWRARGAEMPCPLFRQSLGQAPALIALAGGADGRIRSGPGAVFVAGHPYAAFGVEVARQALALPASVLGHDAAQGGGGWLRMGDHTIRLDPQGAFRFAPTDPAARAERTHRALDLIRGDGPGLPPGAIVLIGSTLPESGGLRPSRIGPLHPSLHLQADAIEQILTKSLPVRKPWGPLAEALATALAGVAGVMLARGLAPIAASLAVFTVALVMVGAAAALARMTGQLLDPTLPLMTLGLTAALGILAEAVASRRTARSLGARMRRHLPHSVVQDLSQRKAGAAVTAQTREITALFTDIEGFSAMTARLAPEALVAVLDRYMTGVTGVVEAHGGMVDKIVGDAVHALFNAPESLADHPRHAIACAKAIAAVTEALRQDPLMQAAGFGRTRIGLETGEAILGDIGRGGRVDYTAHGNVVNLAARLQDANKTLGTQILIGPEAALRAPDAVTPGPEIDLRSFGRLRVSFPAP
jgi:adenylate cyclase